MSVVAALVLAVPGLLLLALGSLWLRAPERLVRGALRWATADIDKDASPPEGATTAARGLGGVLVLTGLLLLGRAAFFL